MYPEVPFPKTLCENVTLIFTTGCSENYILFVLLKCCFTRVEQISSCAYAPHLFCEFVFTFQETVCVCSQDSHYILAASSHSEFYHIISPPHLILELLPAKQSSLISCFIWEKGIVVGFVGFKCSFSNLQIDSWEAGLLSCGAKLVCSQYIVLYEMLIYYGFVVIFKGWDCGCPRICCKLLVIFVFYTNPFSYFTHPPSHTKPKYS